MWNVEPVSPYHCLFVRVHKSNLKPDNSPTTSAFSNTPKNDDNLSSDWCKYATPESSRKLIGKLSHKDGKYKDPSNFYIWRFSVILLNQMNITQNVEHDPIYNNPEIDGVPNNRAHTKIIGQKPCNQAEFKVQIKRSGCWAIPPA